MRNLKRVLSLALASVMLMGMMVVGSSAAFKDDDKIVNDKAVAMAGGFGLFAGDTEGNFNPEGTVTRAQMAAVIAKMFYGSELNADTYKGGNKFTDTASFEGGWAEGYINLGVEKGWFKGYGDGTFKPGQAVTTAEAMTMIINLLGIDAGEGTWPMTVMAAVESAKLFGDTTTMVELKPAPATNVAMTRDQLSVAVVNAMYYSPKGYECYAISGVDLEFDTMADALAYCELQGALAATYADLIYGKAEDTLAETVFDAEPFYGYVVNNQATGVPYTELDNGIETIALNIETGLELLGHFVVAYYDEGADYKTEKNPGTAYCVVDTADYFVVENDIFEDKKAYTAVFGTKVKEYQIADENDIDNDGDKTELIDAVSARTYTGAPMAYPTGTNTKNNVQSYDENTYCAPAGIYAVDKVTGKIDNFIQLTPVTLAEVGFVKTVAGKETIKLNYAASTETYDNNADNDIIVEYEGIAEGDIVAVKSYNYVRATQEGKVYLEKVEPVTGKIDAVSNTKLNGNDVSYVTIGDKEYLVNNDTVYTNGTPSTASINTPATYAANGTNVYDAYIYGGKVLGIKLVSGAGNLADAVFVVDTYMQKVNNGYADVEHYYAQGVNAKGEEVTVLIGIENVNDATDDTTDNDNNGVYDLGYGKFDDQSFEAAYIRQFVTFEKALDRDQAKKDIMYATPAKAYAPTLKEIDGYFGYANAKIIDADNTNTLKKEDKYLYMGTDVAANRLFLTDATQFIVVERPASTTDRKAGELEVATYTGAISKKLTQTFDKDGDNVLDTFNDSIFVAGMADVDGVNKTAELVVIMTEKLNLTVEDYVYIAKDAVYSATADGTKYAGIYFTETNEFKAVTVDGAPKADGFYEIDEIDEDGVYHLVPATMTGLERPNMKAQAVFGNSIILATNDMYALADDAKIYDVRSAEWLEKSEVSEISALKDIQNAIKGATANKYDVYFDMLLKEIDSNTKVITHIFVKSVTKATTGQEI